MEEGSTCRGIYKQAIHTVTKRHLKHLIVTPPLLSSPTSGTTGVHPTPPSRGYEEAQMISKLQLSLDKEMDIRECYSKAEKEGYEKPQATRVDPCHHHQQQQHPNLHRMSLTA